MVDMQTCKFSLYCEDEASLVALARRVAQSSGEGGCIYLRGDLGAGKTTFARGLLQALGVDARIKSPTYSLIESYTIDGLQVHHLDLYRIADPGELEWLGIADLTEGRHLIVIEWPERAAGMLPAADLDVALAHAGAGRDVTMYAVSARAEGWIAAAAKAI